LAAEKRTCHSRPPDDLGLRFTSLVVVVMLYEWLAAVEGLHAFEPELVPDDSGGPSRRTLQRWLRRAEPCAVDFQHHIRATIQDQCEPRPVERLFVGGIPPPRWKGRRWRAPLRVEALFRGLAMTLSAGAALERFVPTLLAEARRRTDSGPFLIA
jgi:hypothetical protein